MAFQLTVLYNHPEKPAEFDAHYDRVHAPLAARIPGLRGYTVSRPAPRGDQKPAYHLVAILTFDDEAAFNAGMASDIGQETVADLANFATTGATTMIGPVETVA